MTTLRLNWNKVSAGNYWDAYCGSKPGTGVCVGIFNNIITVCPAETPGKYNVYRMTEAEKSDVTLAMARAEQLALENMRELFGALAL